MMKPIVCFLAVLLVTQAAPADVVVLKNGHRIEGEVREYPKYLEIELPHGSVRVKREEVLSIERRLTPWQEFEKRLEAISKDDAKSLRELLLWARERGLDNQAKQAGKLLAEALKLEYRKRRGAAGENTGKLRELGLWCEEVGLKEEYTQAMSAYWKTRIDAALETVDRSDARALVTLALKLRQEGALKACLRMLYELALLADPACVEARHALGMQHFDGQWLRASQVDAILRRRHDEKMARSGHVCHGGKWVRPDALALHEKEKRLDRREDEVKAQQARLKAREDDLEQDRRELEGEKSKLELEQARLKEELKAKEAITEQLRVENRLLTRRNYELYLHNRALADRNRDLRRENDRLRRELRDAKK